MKNKTPGKHSYRFIATLCIAITSALFFSGVAITVYGAPGDLDPTFGNDGIVSTSFSNSPYFDTPRSILVQPDGKIIVCGEIIEDSDWEPTVAFFFARYNPNGTLDTSFGTNGKVIAPTNPLEERVRKIALQPDGKFIAVGSRFISSSSRFAVNRYNSDGTLDASFGTGGKVVTQVGNYSSAANDVTVQPDGKIVVVGVDNGFAIVRYNPNGSLDTSFGEYGKVITQFNNRGGVVYSVMLQPDGKIVAAGAFYFSSSVGDTSGFALVRYKADGSLDPSFGIGGTVVHPFPNYSGRITDAVLQPDGRIVVRGNIGAYDTGSNSSVIVRFNSNGSTDTDFAANGIFTPPNTFYSTYGEGDIALQPNGKIITFGESNDEVAALRLNPSGSLDQGFGSNGVATTNFGKGNSFGWNGAIQPDGRILLLGTKWMSDEYHDIAIARFLDDSDEVSISGRVTTANGRGLGNAVVSMVDSLGVRRTATTSTFGYYLFNEIPGDTYTINVRSKRYQFHPRTVFAGDDLFGIDFVNLN